MKNYLLLTLFLLIASVSTAQKHQDAVYLKDGSIIRGMIIEQVPGESLKIKTAGNNVFAYKLDEIKKITKEQREISGYEEGFRGIVEAGYQMGMEGTLDRIKLNVIGGYQINSQLSVGVGSGMRFIYDAESALIPIFADVRGQLFDKNTTPYGALDIGYSFIGAGGGFDRAGVMVSPAAGVNFMIADNTAFSVGINYEYQRVSTSNIHAFGLDLGISF